MSSPTVSPVLPRGLGQMNALIVLTIAGGLLLDYHWVGYGQNVVSAAAWIVCFGLFARAGSHARPALLAGLLLATAGGAFLRVGGGLYQYALANIPLFGAPGEVFVFF